MYPFTAELRLVLLAGILSATFMGFLSLWATAGRFRWYWHVTPLALALTSLVPLGGREPLLVFGVQAGTIVFYELVRKRAASRRARIPFAASFRFGIADAIAATALIGAMLAIARFKPVPGMPHFTLSPDRWVFSGNGLGFATLAGTSLVTVSAGIGRRLLASLILAGGAVTLLLVGDLKEAAFPYSQYGASGIQWSYDWALVFVAAQAGATALWQLLLEVAGWNWWRLHRPPETPDEPSTCTLAAPSRRASVLRLAGRIAVTVGTAWLTWAVTSVYWQILPPFSVPTVVLPTPNGADDLLTVNRQLKWNALSGQDVSLASEQQCGQFAADNEQQLEQIRAMLAKPWLHAVDYADFNKTLTFVHAVRDISCALWADARAQAAQGRFDLAARDYLDMVLLANLSTHGGVSIEEYMADAITGDAKAGLIDHLDQFDPPTLHEIACTIELLDSTREPVEELQARSDLHTAINAGWLGRLVNLAGRVANDPGNSSTAHFRARCDLQLRLIAIEAALRAHVAKHGGLPDSLDALVPEYFRALPLDPFYQYKESPFIYRREGDRFKLYSVGFDGYDDGGLRNAQQDPVRGEKRDLFFDSTLP